MPDQNWPIRLGIFRCRANIVEKLSCPQITANCNEPKFPATNIRLLALVLYAATFQLFLSFLALLQLEERREAKRLGSRWQEGYQKITPLIFLGYWQNAISETESMLITVSDGIDLCSIVSIH